MKKVQIGHGSGCSRRRAALVGLLALAAGTTVAQTANAVPAGCVADTDYVVVEDGNARIVTFANAGTTCIWTVPADTDEIEVLVVGGGGGGGGGLSTVGGRAGGGGGGGGAVLSDSGSVSEGDEFTVVVGAGGAGGEASSEDATAPATGGAPGEGSSFTGTSVSLDAAGGLGGAGGDTEGPAGGVGGDSGAVGGGLGGLNSGSQGGQGGSGANDGNPSVEVNPGRANSITGTEVFYGNGGGGAAPDQFGSDSPAAGSGGGGGRGSLGISGYNYGYFGRGGLPGTVIIRYSLPSAVEVVLEGIPSTATEGDQIDIVPSLSVECEGGTIDVTLVDPQGGTTAVTSGSIDTTGLAPGTYTVSVEYSGDDGCAPATASFPIVIQAPATTVPLELPATGTGSNGSMLMVALLLMTLGGGVVLIGRRAPSR